LTQQLLTARKDFGIAFSHRYSTVTDGQNP